MQPTVSVDLVPIHTVTKAVTGGVAFAVGKSLDVNPRLQLGKLPVKARGWRMQLPCVALGSDAAARQLEVGASLYKEGQGDETTSREDALCLRIKSVNAIVTL